MKKNILEEKVYYYEDAIDNFDELMLTISELEDLSKKDSVDFWGNWVSSSSEEHIYGKTKAFDLSSIEKMNEPYKSKMLFVYHNIMDSLYNVSKDYATSLGDNDEPRLFPTFNIKKYDTNTGMGSHFDQLDGDKTLRYSLVMYLNDDCEGGEISFTLSEYTDLNNRPSPELDYDEAVKNNNVDFGIKPKANSVIIFPSSAPYYHTAHLVKSGFKYMVPGHWIHNDMPMHRGTM